MGIFDFFRKKNSKANTESASYNGELIITNHPKKNLFLPNASLYGFENMENKNHGAFLNEMVDKALQQTPVEENPVYKVCQNGSNRVMQRVIYIISSYHRKNFVASVFPYFKTESVIQFTPHKLTKWDAAIEAEVEGEAQDTFALSFYASDYAINESLYQSGQRLEVKISALALVIDKSEPFEVNGMKFSEDFAALIPNKEAGDLCFYDFIGKLIHFETHTVNELIHGYILTIKMINDEKEDIFTIDVFANLQNMRITDLEIGMRLAGCVWIQGEASKIIA
ncbi:hypothetical protein ACLI08_10635 [Flavobacterium sp. RNTU_13]|uniref:hypothetical protein n=1 Tax=Flavobacterium sp. RNTU_13 TaxID=3375145 RepID=UPI003988A13F